MTTAINRAFQRYIFVYPLDVFKWALFRWKVKFFPKNRVFFEFTMKLAEFGGNLAALVYQKKLRNLLPFQQKKPHQKILIFR